MAAQAQRDIENRTVEVSREKLVTTLEANRQQHIADYEEAMAGYKAVLLTKLEEAFVEAKKTLDDRYEKTRRKVEEMRDEDIAQQSDYFSLVDAIGVEMKVPRSFAKQYDAAIDMAKWDVRETLKLTHAEFTCFVRDQWDWKQGFDAVSAIYKSMSFGASR